MCQLHNTASKNWQRLEFDSGDGNNYDELSTSYNIMGSYYRPSGISIVNVPNASKRIDIEGDHSE